MATTAADTGNDFADAWSKDQWNAARQAVQTQAVAPTADAPTELNQYRTAWNAENNGVYGDIGVEGPAPLQAAAAATEAPKNPFTQQAFQGLAMHGGADGMSGHNSFMYDSSQTMAPGTGGGYTGGYGSWKYGSAIPEAGSEAFKDYQSYWANGGYDPTDMYGKRSQSLADIQARGGMAVDMARLNQPT